MNTYSKSIIIFDLDGTLAKSKQPLSLSISPLFEKLLAEYKVAIISGGSYSQFRQQVLGTLSATTNFSNLFLLPTNGTALYTFKEGAWHQAYSHELSSSDKEMIKKAFAGLLERHPELQNKDIAGVQLEDRGSQMTFSALGQQATLDAKSGFDPDMKKRRGYVEELVSLLPGFSLAIGGMTSIDVVKKGFDKAYGIGKLCEALGIAKERVLYVGDALEPMGNDYSVVEHGIDHEATIGPEQTAVIIEKILQPMNIEKYVEERPWGKFEQFTHNVPSTVKIITVRKGEALSLQYHHGRSEFWRVLSGTPLIVVGDESHASKPGEEFWISVGTKHRISAPNDDVTILEIALGNFDENDIVRLEDNYNRTIGPRSS